MLANLRTVLVSALVTPSGQYGGVTDLPAFSPATAAWLAGAFAAPTAAQSGAWASISAGANTLVVAPTGSGKTLAAFLWSIDRLATEPVPVDPRHRCRVLYISPLKALAVDVDRNLRTPLAGIQRTAERLGVAPPQITVATRTGDTPANERRAFARHPADILITTPESLFLLLTSSSSEALRGVETVIVDEVHAVCGTKRGAHLALSLERLDELLPAPAQRIGLSATVRPVEEVARFLGGASPVAVVRPPASKTIELSVEVPVEDMSAIGDSLGQGGPAAGAIRRSSIWPAVEQRVYDLVSQHRSTIVFTNSRQRAERLCLSLNDLAAENHEATDSRVGEEPGISARVASNGDPPVIARAHHGSVSREQRTEIEEALKTGRIPAVVATSSLELGIDMGAVDLVIQIEAPPSVAAGLQRVGRAGHHVGAVSRGTVFPKHRGDLLSCAIVAERMVEGKIEAISYPRNPLDVLAQQIVAMVSVREWKVDDLAAVVRRSAPFAQLPDSAFHAVLDMLSGRYPSDEFAELRPRLNWDRHTDVLTGRAGSQRLAVTSGGTIPDRGLFGVFLAGADRPMRVGELDEEMVYESRIGDLFSLGSSSWRVEDITHDRVLVSPAPGQPAKAPFWKGETVGRPIELGRALGAFVRELSVLDKSDAGSRARNTGLDAWAADNLMSYLDEQRTATRYLPDDATIVVERCRDELGDWQIIIHSLFGVSVNAPWAMVLASRLRERFHVDVQTLPTDDGIVLRLPDTTAEDPLRAESVALTASEVEEAVTAEVGGSALFAARFRECAARALLLPRRNPGKRTPLWQQRQRSQQLLGVASGYGSFPIVMETMRECLHDVFDVPGLTGLMHDIEARRVKIVEVTTTTPSPFARSMLFAYVGSFLYEGDAPLAERRAQALSLDATMLAELLGKAELRELLDLEVIARVEAELQHLVAQRHARSIDDAHDQLRVLGSLTSDEAHARGVSQEWLEALVSAGRALPVRVAGEQRYIAVEDAARYRDALGVALPVGVPAVFTEPVADPLGDVIGRYAKTHSPFTVTECARRLGLAETVVDQTLSRLELSSTVTRGEFRPDGVGAEWCDAHVLRMVRRRCLAALRKQVEPVPPTALGAFLPAWHGIGAGQRGPEALAAALEQLQGAVLPASAWESVVLPARVTDYDPRWLDDLCAAGELLWCGAGPLTRSDGWLSYVFADAPELMPAAAPLTMTPIHDVIVSCLDGGQALFYRDIVAAVRTSHNAADDRSISGALWDLAWAGFITNDTPAPLRALVSATRTRHPVTRRPTARFGRTGSHRMAPIRPPATVSGRWSLLTRPVIDNTAQLHATAGLLLERLGIVTRDGVLTAEVPGGFAAVYKVLTAAEEAGKVRRGYFVEGLGAAQFAVPGAIEELRAVAARIARADELRDATTPPETDARPNRQGFPRSSSASGSPNADTRPGYPTQGDWSASVPTRGQSASQDSALVLAALDPANVYGAAVPWPVSVGEDDHKHLPGRKAGAHVVLLDGAAVLFVERGGRSVVTFSAVPESLRAATQALAEAVHNGRCPPLTVERVDGRPVAETPLARALTDAGFVPTPRGLRIRRARG